MGSIEAACISGFLCRLCSEMHRTVIHIYGDQGQRHGLAMKINAYLPVTITPNDPLPKTICRLCMSRVEQHHELMLKMEKHRSMFALQATRMHSIRVQAARTNSQISSAASNNDEDSPTVDCNVTQDRLEGRDGPEPADEGSGSNQIAAVQSPQQTDEASIDCARLRNEIETNGVQSIAQDRSNIESRTGHLT